MGGITEFCQSSEGVFADIIESLHPPVMISEQFFIPNNLYSKFIAIEGTFINYGLGQRPKIVWQEGYNFFLLLLEMGGGGGIFLIHLAKLVFVY